MSFDMMINSNLISTISNYLTYKCDDTNQLVMFVAENMPLINNTEDRIKLLRAYCLAHDRLTILSMK